MASKISWRTATDSNAARWCCISSSHLSPRFPGPIRMIQVRCAKPRSLTPSLNRPASPQINLADDPLVNDDFAYATREGLIPPMKRVGDHVEIDFDIALTPLVAGEDNQVVARRRLVA